MRSKLGEDFLEAYRLLPKTVQKQARQAYRRFKQNPYHPGLRFKLVDPAQKIYSVRIGLYYRALGVLDGDLIVWFWIGSHSGYDHVV